MPEAVQILLGAALGVALTVVAMLVGGRLGRQAAIEQTREQEREQELLRRAIGPTPDGRAIVAAATTALADIAKARTTCPACLAALDRQNDRARERAEHIAASRSVPGCDDPCDRRSS